MQLFYLRSWAEQQSLAEAMTNETSEVREAVAVFEHAAEEYIQALVGNASVFIDRRHAKAEVERLGIDMVEDRTRLLCELAFCVASIFLQTVIDTTLRFNPQARKLLQLLLDQSLNRYCMRRIWSCRNIPHSIYQ